MEGALNSLWQGVGCISLYPWKKVNLVKCIEKKIEMKKKHGYNGIGPGKKNSLVWECDTGMDGYHLGEGWGETWLSKVMF